MFSKNRLTIIIIALFSLVQLLFLTQPLSLVWDEQHYVKAARLMVRGYPDYNIAHPPLGKQMIAASMKALGDNPWGWRVPSFLFSITTIVLIFVFARRFFGEKAALLATLLLALDPLWIAVSRLAMLDVFATFFAVLFFMLMFHYLEKPNLKLAVASGTALGASLAAKWSGVLLPLLFVTIATGTYYLGKLGKRGLAYHLMMFYFILVAIYISSFILQSNPQKGRLSLVDRHVTAVIAQLGAKSPQPELIPDFSPLLWFTAPTLGALAVSPEDKSLSPTVLFFSPLAGWITLLSSFFLVRRVIKDRTCGNPAENMKSLSLVLALFLFYLPWVVSGRPSVIHDMMPLLPFVYLIQAKAWTIFLEKRGGSSTLLKGYLIATIFCTAFLFPFLFGLPVANKCLYSLPFLLLAFATSFAIFFLGLRPPRRILSFLRQ